MERAPIKERMSRMSESAAKIKLFFLPSIA
jgi:hypothetical protein